jgi:hypothetical protein
MKEPSLLPPFIFSKCLAATLILIATPLASKVNAAGLAVTPGVTIDILDKIDQVGDEDLREMLKTAVWPGFGENYLDLDRPEAELTQFEKNYKTHPLNWDEKIENVRYLLDEADDLSALTVDNVEYKDIVFGESVIPVADRRVTEILNNTYLSAEMQNLAEQKQAAMAALNNDEDDNIGSKLQSLEDEYATKLATLSQAENAYKEAKIEFLKLENQKKYGRIDDETYQNETRRVVENFESFFSIGIDTPLFDEEKIRQIASSIYDDTIQIKTNESVYDASEKPKEINVKGYYWAISILLMLLALLMGYLAFRKIVSTRKK